MVVLSGAHVVGHGKRPEARRDLRGEPEWTTPVVMGLPVAPVGQPFGVPPGSSAELPALSADPPRFRAGRPFRARQPEALGPAAAARFRGPARGDEAGSSFS
jgi:hypothetical protein